MVVDISSKQLKQWKVKSKEHVMAFTGVYYCFAVTEDIFLVKRLQEGLV